MTALCCTDLTCLRPDWTHGPSRVESLTAEFAEASIINVTGPPGSGKTLLLHLLGLLERPDSGTVKVFGQDATSPPEDVRREIRNAVFGFVFARPCLLPALTVAENVAIPLFRFSSSDAPAAGVRVSEILTQLDIEPLARELADTLPSTDQHLVALARALVHRPRILVIVAPAEPAALLAPVQFAARELGITCLWSDSTGTLSGRCDREILLTNGRVAGERVTLA